MQRVARWSSFILWRLINVAAVVDRFRHSKSPFQHLCAELVVSSKLVEADNFFLKKKFAFSSLLSGNKNGTIKVERYLSFAINNEQKSRNNSDTQSFAQKRALLCIKLHKSSFNVLWRQNSKMFI
jgi:hypothetical protein